MKIFHSIEHRALVLLDGANIGHINSVYSILHDNPKTESYKAFERSLKQPQTTIYNTCNGKIS